MVKVVALPWRRRDQRQAEFERRSGSCTRRSESRTVRTAATSAIGIVAHDSEPAEGDRGRCPPLLGTQATLGAGSAGILADHGVQARPPLALPDPDSGAVGAADVRHGVGVHAPPAVDSRLGSRGPCRPGHDPGGSTRSTWWKPPLKPTTGTMIRPAASAGGAVTIPMAVGADRGGGQRYRHRRGG